MQGILTQLTRGDLAALAADPLGEFVCRSRLGGVVPLTIGLTLGHLVSGPAIVRHFALVITRLEAETLFGDDLAGEPAEVNRLFPLILACLAPRVSSPLRSPMLDDMPQLPRLKAVFQLKRAPLD
jgi:hypothetical protein